jgi:hypothetical protein
LEEKKMKKRNNIIKAGALLVAVVMLLSILPAVTADDGSKKPVKVEYFDVDVFLRGTVNKIPGDRWAALPNECDDSFVATTLFCDDMNSPWVQDSDDDWMPTSNAGAPGHYEMEPADAYLDESWGAYTVDDSNWWIGYQHANSAQDNENDWVISPAFDTTGLISAEIEFELYSWGALTDPLNGHIDLVISDSGFGTYDVNNYDTIVSISDDLEDTFGVVSFSIPPAYLDKTGVQIAFVAHSEEIGASYDARAFIQNLCVKGELPFAGCDFWVEINNIIDGGFINELPHVINVTVGNNGPTPIYEVKKLVDIYEKICGETTNIWCDDMESYSPYCPDCDDNENWTVFDNGDEDTWTLQTDNFHSPGQAYRCTLGKYRDPGSPDTYLGSATAGDNDMLILNTSWDLRGAMCGKISFWHYAVGEYTFDSTGAVIPIDYGIVEISFDNGATWTNVNDGPGLDFFAYNNGWQEVEIYLLNSTIHDICNDCDVDPESDIILTGDFYDSGNADQGLIKIRFSWIVDPCLQFEGWYIDDVCVDRTEKYSLKLVFQTHSIQSIPGGLVYPDGIYEEFPLEFDPEPDTWYQIDVCGQVFSPADCEPPEMQDNNCDTAQFLIQDIHDMSTVAVVDCPPDGEFGDDLTYQFTVKNVGTYAENNVPVDLVIAPRLVATYIDDDFETSDPIGDYLMLTRSTCDANANDLWHWDTSGFKTTSGTGALACYNGVYSLEPNMCQSVETIQSYDIEHATWTWEMAWSHPFMDPFTTGIFIICGHEDVGGYIIYYYTYWEDYYYDNDFMTWEIEMKDFVDSVFGVPGTVGAVFPTYDCYIGYSVRTDSNLDQSHPSNPEPWTGVVIDDLSLKYDICDMANAQVVDTQYTGALDINEEETLTFYWNDTMYSNWCVCADTNLVGDADTTNDILCCGTLITSESTAFTYTHEDLTGQPPDSLWHCCCKHTFDPEPPCDCYAWNGVEYDTYGYYTNNLDDSMISPTIDLSGAPVAGATLSYDNWYEFADANDYGEIYVSDDNGTSWTLLGTTVGLVEDWHITSWTIPQSLCSAQNKFKFRMISDDTGVNNGWYIDDVAVGYNVELLNEGFEGFMSGFPPAGWTKVLEDGGTSSNDVTQSDYYAHTGTYSAEFSSYGWSTDYDQWLITPAVTIDDFGGEDTFEFHYMADTWGTETFAVEVATSLGGPWTQIGSDYTYSSTTWTSTGPIDLSAYDGQTIYIGIHYKSIYEYYFYVDDVILPDGTTESFEGMDTGWPPSGWSETILHWPSGAMPDWDIATQSRYTTPIIFPTTGNYMAFFNSWSCLGPKSARLSTMPLDFSTITGNLPLTFMMYHDTSYASNVDQLQISATTDGSTWVPVGSPIMRYDGTDAWAQHSIDLSAFNGESSVEIGFDGIADLGNDIYIDDIFIGGSISIFTEDFEDCLATTGLPLGWTGHKTLAGDYWDFDTDMPDAAGIADGTQAWNLQGYPSTGPGLNNALNVKVDLSDKEYTFAQLRFDEAFALELGVKFYCEASIDGENWDSIYMESNEIAGTYSSGGWLPRVIDLNDYLGNMVTVRFRYTTPGEGLFTALPDHGMAVDNFVLKYKEMIYTDELPPVTTASFDPDTGIVTLLAYDQAGPVVSGLAATYYKLDGGSQTTYVDPITLTEGSHTIEFWSVDNAGNEESHKTRTFVVDTTAPTIDITEPEENALYLFGNKIMNRILGSGTLCIGKVTIKATASDASGINMVTFEIDGDTGFDVTAPYEYTYNDMVFGDVSVTATAFDINGLSNTDTMSFKMYSLGIF